MRKLALAFVIVLSAAAICFVLLRLLYVDEDLMGSIFETGAPRAISALFLGAITVVHRWLETKEIRPNFNALPGKIASFDSYTLPWRTMVIYGILIAYAASGLGTLVVWLFGSITGIFFTRTVPGLNVLFVCIAFYLLGSWIGARCDRLQFLTTVIVVLVFKLVATTIDLIFAPSFGISTVVIFVLSTLLYLLVALVGLWRGHRVRLARYLRYLLSFLPPENQKLVVNSTYEEAQRLSPDNLQPAPQNAQDIVTP